MTPPDQSRQTVMQENEAASVDAVCIHLLDLLSLPEPPDVPQSLALVAAFRSLRDKILFLREFLLAASNGDFSRPVAMRGFVGGTLKTLQANLRHMTWQTKMVASGDFTQRLHFMGEFSHAFNAMVIQLDQTLKDLVAKEAELRKAIEDLHREIAIRHQAEKALRDNEETLRRLATTDALTGLHSRGHFNKLAESAVRSAIRHSRPLSVVAFDIDFFKRINDTFGHSAGDDVLKKVSTIAAGALRASDVLARYGGEEFIVLLPETPESGAAAVAEKLRMLIETGTARSRDCPSAVTASFGVSGKPGKWRSSDHEKELSALISAADQALYESKNRGRNRVSLGRGS